MILVGKSWENWKYLNLSYDDLKPIKGYVDTSFAVHPDFNSQTGAIITMGKGYIQSFSREKNWTQGAL